jgi:hypothetical protein
VGVGREVEKDVEKVVVEKNLGATRGPIGIGGIAIVIVDAVDLVHETTVAVLRLIIIIIIVIIIIIIIIMEEEEGGFPWRDEMILVARPGRCRRDHPVGDHHPAAGPIPAATAVAAAGRIRTVAIAAAVAILRAAAAVRVVAAPVLVRTRRNRRPKTRSTARTNARFLSTSSS